MMCYLKVKHSEFTLILKICFRMGNEPWSARPERIPVSDTTTLTRAYIKTAIWSRGNRVYFVHQLIPETIHRWLRIIRRWRGMWRGTETRHQPENVRAALMWVVGSGSPRNHAETDSKLPPETQVLCQVDLVQGKSVLPLHTIYLVRTAGLKPRKF